MPKISVLVPVYNSQKFLRMCLESIRIQTFTDFEVVIVDDGSTDNSGVICDEYSQNDGRFKVFHKQNEGISATRNFALRLATGEYFLFVDSDDAIDKNTLELTYTHAQINDADVVGFNFLQKYPHKTVHSHIHYSTKDEFVRDMIRGHWATVWKMLIQKKLVSDNNICFPKGIDGGEDYYFCSLVLLASVNPVYIDEVLYRYNCRNTNSFIRTPSLKKLNYQVQATLLLENHLQQGGLKKLFSSEIEIRKRNVKKKMLYYNLSEGQKLFPEIDYDMSYRDWLFAKIKRYAKSLLTM